MLDIPMQDDQDGLFRFQFSQQTHPKREISHAFRWFSPQSRPSWIWTVTWMDEFFEDMDGAHRDYSRLSINYLQRCRDDP